MCYLSRERLGEEMNPSLEERSGVVALGDISTVPPVRGVAGQSGDELLVSTILSPVIH